MRARLLKHWTPKGLGGTAPHLVRITTQSTPKAGHKISSDRFADASSVAKYLEGTPFASSAVRRIHLGSTNFTYRLFLEAPYGLSKVDTAILKWAAAHTAGEPCTPFSPKRQCYEARALTRIPWEQLTAPASSPDSASGHLPKLRLPKLYLEDSDRRVIIMEDGTPRKGTCDIWDESSHSSRFFFEDVPASSSKYQTARVIGRLLGSFLVRLQQWGSSPQNSQLVYESFAGNASAKELTIDETFKDFGSSVEETGFLIPLQLRRELEAKLSDLEERLCNQLETLAMGDFWLGNVLLSFRDKDLQTINIIDWEFTMLAPAFLDLGHFIGEVFLIHYFEANDAVYIELLESFLDEYRSLVQDLDIDRILGYAGAHITMALPRRIRSPRSRATKETAIPCQEVALKFIIDPKFSNSKFQNKDPLEILLQLMRDRGLT